MFICLRLLAMGHPSELKCRSEHMTPNSTAKLMGLAVETHGNPAQLSVFDSVFDSSTDLYTPGIPVWIEISDVPQGGEYALSVHGGDTGKFSNLPQNLENSPPGCGSQIVTKNTPTTTAPVRVAWTLPCSAEMPSPITFVLVWSTGPNKVAFRSHASLAPDKFACGQVLGHNVTLKWTLDKAQGKEAVTAEVSVPAHAWLGVGLSNNQQMVSTSKQHDNVAVIFKPSGSQECDVAEYALTGENVEQIVKDTSDLLSGVECEQTIRLTRFTFTRPQCTDASTNPMCFPANFDGKDNVLYAYGEHDQFMYHTTNRGVAEVTWKPRAPKTTVTTTTVPGKTTPQTTGKTTPGATSTARRTTPPAQPTTAPAKPTPPPARCTCCVRYCQRVIDEWFTIGWQIADAAGSASISVNVEYNASKNDAPNGWIGFGFAGSSDGDAMNQAYAIIGGAMEGGSDGRLTGPDEIPAAPLRRRFTRSEASTEPPEASLTVEEFKLPSSGKASTASIRAGKLQDSALENAMIIRAPGKKFIMAFTRNLVSKAPGRPPFVLDQNTSLIFAFGELTPKQPISYHKHRTYVSSGFSWATDDNGAAPSTGGGGLDAHTVVLHAVLMVVGWAALLPVGVLIARFRPGAGATWFQAHRVTQFVGLVAVIVAFVLILKAYQASGKENFNSDHARIGLAAVVLGLLQPFNAFIRPSAASSGFKRTQARALWEVVHKGAGYVAILLAWLNIVLGLQLNFVVNAFDEGVTDRIAVTFYVMIGLLCAAGVGSEVRLIYGPAKSEVSETVYEGF